MEELRKINYLFIPRWDPNICSRKQKQHFPSQRPEKTQYINNVKFCNVEMSVNSSEQII